MDTSFILDMLAAQYKASDVFDYVDVGIDTGVYWSAKKVGAETLICLRGSITLEDWLRDLETITIPMSHSILGPLHPGFHKNMEAVWDDIQSKFKPPFVVAGHSLGAARAAILSGLMLIDGWPPVKRIGFGEPHPGFSKLRAFLSGIPAELYRCREGIWVDTVSAVPLPPYEASGIVIDLPGEPRGIDAFRLHHIDVYQAAYSRWLSANTKSPQQPPKPALSLGLVQPKE